MEKSWELPEVLWKVIKDKIPEKSRSPKGGRPPVNPKEVMRGIFYTLRTGVQWKWQSIDGAMTKAPLGGKKNRQKPYRPRKVRHKAIFDNGWQRDSASHRG